MNDDIRDVMSLDPGCRRDGRGGGSRTGTSSFARLPKGAGRPCGACDAGDSHRRLEPSRTIAQTGSEALSSGGRTTSRRADAVPSASGVHG